MYQWDVREFNDIDSSFAFQEFIQDSLRKVTPDVPLSDILQCPEDQDAECWQNEHLRQICQDLEALVVLLLPACNSTTCPLMKATEEEQYRCAAHKKPQDVRYLGLFFVCTKPVIVLRH